MVNDGVSFAAAYAKMHEAELQAQKYFYECKVKLLELEIERLKVFEPKNHGTLSAYSKGCRCERCKQAASDYQRMYRRVKK